MIEYGPKILVLSLLFIVEDYTIGVSFSGCFSTEVTQPVVNPIHLLCVIFLGWESGLTLMTRQEDSTTSVWDWKVKTLSFILYMCTLSTRSFLENIK